MTISTARALRILSESSHLAYRLTGTRPGYALFTAWLEFDHPSTAPLDSRTFGIQTEVVLPIDDDQPADLSEKTRTMLRTSLRQQVAGLETQAA